DRGARRVADENLPHRVSFPNPSACQSYLGTEREGVKSAAGICSRMIFSENRVPLFGIMLLFAHDLFRKPRPTFRDHAFVRACRISAIVPAAIGADRAR